MESPAPGSSPSSIAPTAFGGSSPNADAVSLPVTIGPYRILRRLGEGGMGIVFEAEQERPRRNVALKVIRGGHLVDEQQVRMFQREVDTLARLKHPNIAAIYDAGRTDAGQHYFAMELVHGRTLGEYLDSRPKPSERDELRFRLRLFVALCEAVGYAHQRGVIHRDLKPSNVVVTEPDPGAPGSRSGVPDLKVLDFGLARITDADAQGLTVQSEIGVIKGTLPYMSPEQARGDSDQIDVRTDVYALGVILYEMLAGKRPLDVSSKSIAEALYVICEQPPPPLRQSWSGSRPPDADLQTIVGKALEKSSDRRYSSAAALAEDVERYLDSRPILARPPSTMYQLRKLASRHRTLVAGAAATLLALVAGIVVSTNFGFREAAQRRAAEQAQHDLEAVSEFQAGMLAQMDAPHMGEKLVADLASRLGAAEREAGAPDGGAAAVAMLQKQLARINATDASLHVIDENVLSPAVASAETTFATRPLIRAQLLRSIGNTYLKLGLLDRAESTFVTARQLGERAAGPMAVPTLTAMRQLSDLYLLQGRMDEAEPLVTATLAGQQKTLGKDHTDALQTMNTLGMLWTDQGRFASAESLFAILLPLQQKAQGPEHPYTLSVMANYAWMFNQAEKFAQAESLGVLSLALRRKVLGNQHPETMQSVNNLAVIYTRMKRPELAEPLYLEDYEMSRKLLGEEHPDLAVSRTNLGRLYNRLGKYDKAEAMLSKALAVTRKTMPHEFMGTAITVLAHAEALVGLGRLREAEPELLEAHGLFIKLEGEESPGAQRAIAKLVEVYEKTGRGAMAESWKKRRTPLG